MSNNILVSPVRILLESLKIFYGTKGNLERFLFLRDTKKSNVSLRTFDKYTTQYVRFNTVTFPGTNKSVYDSYKEQLKSWKKRMFDPNARDHSDKLKKDHDAVYLKQFNLHFPGIGTLTETNVPQMNFFRWVIQNNIYELIIKDLPAIKTFIKSKNKEKASVKKNKDKPLYRRDSIKSTKSLIGI